MIVPLFIAIGYCLIISKLRKTQKEIEEDRKNTIQDHEVIHFYRNIIDDCFCDIYSKHKDILTADIQEAKKRGDWNEVIRIGKYGSRLFLMLSKYDLRIEYGNYVIEAAQKLVDFESVAMGHIDCLGWSYVKKNDFKNAREHINIGLDIVKDLNTETAIILRCKAYRHSCGIYLKDKTLDIHEQIKLAKQERDKFSDACKSKKIKGRNKAIMLASLHIIDGDICRSEKNNIESKRFYELARELFKKCGDKDRLVKTQYKLGEINEIMGQHPAAIREYLIGFYTAKKICRTDELYKNCKAICNFITAHSQEFSAILSDEKFKKALESECNLIIQTNTEFYFEEQARLKEKIETT